MQSAVRDATLEDVYYIAAHLRQADLDEFTALYSAAASPTAILAASRVCSELCQVGTVDGVPALIYGVAPLDAPTAGTVWMVGTRALEDPAVARRFLRECRDGLREMNEMYPLLVNHVDARNALSVRWLRWLGFTFINLRLHGAEHRPFYEFVRLHHV